MSTSAYDVLCGHSLHLAPNSNATFTPSRPQKIVHPKTHPQAELDWDEFLKQQYQADDEMEQKNRKRRKLLNYDHVEPWFNYFAMLGKC